MTLSLMHPLTKILTEGGYPRYMIHFVHPNGFTTVYMHGRNDSQQAILEARELAAIDDTGAYTVTETGSMELLFDWAIQEVEGLA